MARAPASPPQRRRRSPPRSPSKSETRAEKTSLLELLDDELDEYTVGDWRARNLRLTEILSELGLYDTDAVPYEAHRLLTDSLIHVLNGAATDPQNAGHVRAQNENVLHYG